MQIDNAHLDSRQAVAANIPKFYIYTALKGLNFGLLIAIWVIYVQRRYGLNLTQVTLLDVAFWLASTLGEIPTGVVADSYGRKLSLTIGAAMMAVSTLAWALAPTVPFVALSYVIMALGVTFLSGAEDALIFESLKQVDRVKEYTRFTGRISATSIAAAAVGTLISGALATIDLRLPFFLGALSLFAVLGIVLTFKEPEGEKTEGVERPSYGQILKDALSIMRQRPTLRYAILYLTLVPITAMVVETVFLQPQAIAWGVPLAGIGLVTMATQVSKMAGSTSAHRIKEAVGDRWVIYLAPLAIAICLLLLGAIDTLSALLFAAGISVVTAIIRPIVMYRIQSEVSDTVRATVLSMQSLLFAGMVAVVEPLLGYIADQAGLPVSYYALAGGLLLFMLLLFWRGRQRFP